MSIIDAAYQLRQVLHVELDAIIPGFRQNRWFSGRLWGGGAPRHLLSVRELDRQPFGQSDLTLDVFSLVGLQPLYRALLWPPRHRRELAVEVQPHRPFGPQARGRDRDISPHSAPKSLQRHFVHKQFLSLSTVSVPHSPLSPWSKYSQILAKLSPFEPFGLLCRVKLHPGLGITSISGPFLTSCGTKDKTEPLTEMPVRSPIVDSVQCHLWSFPPPPGILVRFVFI